MPALKLTSIASGLSAPLFATSPAGDARLFVVEQGGRIRIIQGGAVLPTPFLDVSASISTGGERGLLGLAMHPGYASNGRFWINYTDTSGNTAVVEYKASTTDPNVADPQPVRVLLGIAQPFANHNGGMLAFGPDGYLYIGMGDGGSGGDPQGNGQNPQSELGKILRVDVDSYPTPAPGNMPGGNPHVWDMGVRNPWRFSFDRATGDLYIADVGQNAWEEVNVEPAGQGHRNYGWNTMEGTHCYQPSSGCSQAGLTLPVAEYSHDNGCSITGGYAYRGAAIPCLQGRYLYADYCSHRIWSFVWNGSAATDPKELTAELDPGDSITSFGEDAQGEAYVVTAAGTVYRIEEN
ncbi:MAG: PQQ-dependent sugar dehydrogenase [Deltaproteobacteria bacterium]|nr:PQQ-dependent sugar dehydrogenase [Deltaproteobacteria bacterium]